jgi:hypothetical protein
MTIFHGDFADEVAPPGDDHFAAGVAVSAFGLMLRQIADINVF